jgi:hypothetical protein
LNGNERKRKEKKEIEGKLGKKETMGPLGDLKIIKKEN